MARIWPVLLFLSPIAFAQDLDGATKQASRLLDDSRLQARGTVSVIERYPVEGVNRGLKDGPPTIDLTIHILEGSKVDWETMLMQLGAAKQVFGEHGIQIRVLSARKLRAPADWLALTPVAAFTRDSPDPSLSEKDLYAYLDIVQMALTEKARQVFDGVLEDVPNAEQSLQVIAVGQVTIPNYERDDSGAWKISQRNTGGLSFPPYMFEDRLPPRFRGLITLSPKTGLPPKALAHEIGHKLINVSHEGIRICPIPVPPIDGRPELMLYGPGSEIPSGFDGRWQAERLPLSPLLYSMKDGKKVWNPPYRENGRYGDPIYGSFYMNPTCPATLKAAQPRTGSDSLDP